MYLSTKINQPKFPKIWSFKNNKMKQLLNVVYTKQ